MNSKVAHKSFFLGLLVLIAILLQAAHTLGHLAEQISEPHCDHHYAEGKNTVNHSHHEAEPCFICSFQLTSATTPSNIDFSFKSTAAHAGQPLVAYSVFFSIFSGSSYTLRGPPQFIV